MQDITRDTIRDVASTLAHHWAMGCPKDREGVRRIVASYPAPMRLPLCSLILQRLDRYDADSPVQDFEGLLFDMADIEEAI